ncbi:MAG TPA: prepilin-type N-terminal cleavage/methylation domain-containing protein [Candidatus Acidoferrales bacterium]|jgi:prepilin-type N-terminal cleavage/methylation domain-containing protein|nr:prepilin-type N-terminal cleavage/methylation domain-containing protein [Candidatus Acidoferrales bacterium]
MKFNETSRASSRGILGKRSKAFTLVEIMLALAIFSMLIAALYATWTLVIKATIVGKRAGAQRQRERIAMGAIEDSLTCIQSHQASIYYYLFNIQNGDQPLLSFAAYLPDSFPRSGEFLNNTPDGVPMDYHLRGLIFSLQSEQDGEKDLILRQSPILMPMNQSEISTPLVLARDVSDFLVECWDTNTAEWDTEWDATNMIPPLVRVTLAFDIPNGPKQVITREISFPSSTMPSAVQSPSFNAAGGGGYQTFMNSMNSGGGANSESGNSGSAPSSSGTGWPPWFYNPYGSGLGASP